MKSEIEFSGLGFSSWNLLGTNTLYQGTTSVAPDRPELVGFSLCGCGITAPRSLTPKKTRGLKPSRFSLRAARLKSCPDTNHPTSDFRITAQLSPASTRSRSRPRAGLSGRDRRRGSALLAVLWLTAALAAIGFALSSTVRSETDRTANAAEGARAYFLASGAVERAALEWMWSRMNPTNPRIPLGAGIVDYDFPNGAARVEIVPETSKLNVNTAPPAQLYQLCLALGLEPGRAREIATAIDEWRRPVESPEFDAFYLSLTPSFQQPHASFQEIEELLLVKGVTPDIFYGGYAPSEEPGGAHLVARTGLADCLSVYGSHDRVDVNTAKPEVLAAVGLAPQLVGALLERRRSAPLDPQQLAQFLDSEGAQDAMLRVGGNSIYFMRATARLRVPGGGLSDLKRTVAASVKYMPTGYDSPIHILRWYDSAWSN